MLDGVAARIGDGPTESVTLILRSDVELRARLALLASDPERAFDAQLSSGLLSAALSELIGELLIAREAERVQIAAPAASEVARELSRMTAAGGAQLDGFLARIGADRRELEVTAKRRATVAAFLRANLEGAMVVTEHEIDERMQNAESRLPGEDDASARVRIASVLAKEALRRNIERWVRVLRSRVPVRVLASYEGA